MGFSLSCTAEAEVEAVVAPSSPPRAALPVVLCSKR
jgi:hypothetical protein